MRKRKLLIISDHAFSKSGVGIQSKFLIEGLLKTGRYKIVQLGAAKRHASLDIIDVNKDFKIIPSNGFGNKDILRSLLATEKPDALIIFTDARFFKYLFEMEDEVHQVCPILWWHVWDNRPTPNFNNWIYDSIDAINCISYLTYSMCKENYSKKSKYIPHALPENLFYRIEDEQKKEMYKKEILGDDKSKFFTGLWVNRNCKRKRPADLLKAWQIFLRIIKDKHSSEEAMLLMHTDPYDEAGINLIELAKELNIQKNVRFSTAPIDFEEMNILHNISDFCINISSSEGFGLSTLEAMTVGNPIIATATGGLTTQVINRHTGELNGLPLQPDVTTIAGNQEILYMNEDYVKVENIAYSIYNLWNTSDDVRAIIGNKGMTYVKKEFNCKKMINDWDNSIITTISDWKSSYKRIKMKEF